MKMHMSMSTVTDIPIFILMATLKGVQNTSTSPLNYVMCL